MPRERSSGPAQLRLRQMVLDLYDQVPRPSLGALAKLAGAKLNRTVPKSTVQNILKVFRDRGDDLEDRKRSGRPSPYTKQMKRCEGVV